jgi:hypothetical protein
MNEVDCGKGIALVYDTRYDALMFIVKTDAQPDNDSKATIRRINSRPVILK